MCALWEKASIEITSIFFFKKKKNFYCHSVLEILQDRILEWLAVPSPADLPNPGIEPRSPAWQEDSLQAEPQGKPCGFHVLLSKHNCFSWLCALQKIPFVIYHHATKLIPSFTVKRITLWLPSHSVLTIAVCDPMDYTVYGIL